MAYMVALETNEHIDDIIWYMPLAQIFTLLPMISSTRSGEQYDNKRDKLIRRKRMEILEEKFRK